MPFVDLLRDLAAQGLNIKDSAKALGMGYHSAQKLSYTLGVEFDRSHRRTLISLERRQEFWSLLGSMAETGLNRRQCADALGYHHDRFCKMLADCPDKDPFDAYNIAARYLAESGQTIGDAAREFAAAGMTISEAARRIGYGKTAIGSFRKALEARGIKVEFASRSGPSLKHSSDRFTQADARKIKVKTPWREATDRRYAIERVRSSQA
jgi:hypothetical protein